MGAHVVQAYSMIGLVMDLYVWMSVSLFFPHVVPVSALYIFMVLYALVLVYFICSANVSLGSKVSPNIVGKGLVARILLLILRVRDLEYSAGSGVNRVVCVLLVLRMRLFCVAQLVIVSKYGCSIVSAVLKLVCVDVIVMSSAYPVSLIIGLGGRGISDRYRLNSEGDSTPPWGTPVLKICILDS